MSLPLLLSVDLATKIHEVEPVGGCPWAFWHATCCTYRNRALFEATSMMFESADVSKLCVTPYRAPSRAALVMRSQDPNRRPTSKIRKKSASRRGTSSTNSTVDCPRWFIDRPRGDRPPHRISASMLRCGRCAWNYPYG